MRGRTPNKMDYGWESARADLEAGYHPEVVAARLGEPIDFVLETADAQGWSITWSGPTAEQILDAFEYDA